MISKNQIETTCLNIHFYFQFYKSIITDKVMEPKTYMDGWFYNPYCDIY